jgi:hypothetical protein
MLDLLFDELKNHRDYRRLRVCTVKIQLSKNVDNPNFILYN